MKIKILCALLMLGNTFAEAPGISGCFPRVQTKFYQYDGSIPDNNEANPLVLDIPVNITNEKIMDVDIGMSITHTFPGDLRISLISPTGTEVLLSGQTGGTNDGIFDGVDFDDQANKDLPTYPFTNGVAIGKVNPQSPLSKFSGQLPNGTWKLKIADVAAGDSGGLLDGIITFTTCQRTYGTSAEIVATSTAAVAIPDNDGTGVKSPITLDSSITSLCSLEIVTNISHDKARELDLYLISPQGLEIVLGRQPSGGTNTFQSTTWSDLSTKVVKGELFGSLGAVSSLAPSQAFASFYGIDPNGTWNLKVRDNVALATGTINSWSLKLKGCGKDTDQDGSADIHDACLNDPAKTEAGICGCGVPDVDANGNGVIDCKLTSEVKKYISEIKALLIALPSQTKAQKLVTLASIKLKVLELKNLIKTKAVKIQSGKSKLDAIAKIESAKNSLVRGISSSRISNLSKTLTALSAILLAD